MERKSGTCTSSRSYSFTLGRSGFQKPSLASSSSLLYPPDHWTKIPAGLHAVAVLVGRVGYGQCTSTSCTRQGKHGKHHDGTTSRSLAHRIAEGMHTGQSAPIGPISTGLQQTAVVSPGNRMVNGAKLVFHPNIKLRHVVFSDQGGSWHCLKYIRAASVCSCLGCRDLSNKKGQITNTAWKNSSGTMLLQLQQLHSCDWKDNWLPKYARLSLDGGWRRA